MAKKTSKSRDNGEHDGGVDADRPARPNAPTPNAPAPQPQRLTT